MDQQKLHCSTLICGQVFHHFLSPDEARNCFRSSGKTSQYLDPGCCPTSVLLKVREWSQSRMPVTQVGRESRNSFRILKTAFYSAQPKMFEFTPTSFIETLHNLPFCRFKRYVCYYECFFWSSRHLKRRFPPTSATIVPVCAAAIELEVCFTVLYRVVLCRRPIDGSKHNSISRGRSQIWSWRLPWPTGTASPSACGQYRRFFRAFFVWRVPEVQDLRHSEETLKESARRLLSLRSRVFVGH
jgi:hypothetical protein